jgi:NSS family neurotransmitter:Na+ symporter
MGEWSIGRHTRRGTLGAFQRLGVPGGNGIGWLLMGTTWFAVAYYTNAIGWVFYHFLAELLTPLGRPLDPSRILPPATGFSATSMALQLGCTGLLLLAEASIVLRGIRGGIERASKLLTPVLYGTLLVLIARSLTLPGAGEGVRWLLAFHASEITPTVAIAALGQVVFSVGLGGTLMLVYGSYLADGADIRADATWTVAGDTLAGLLAGLAIFPAVFALGMEPGSGPGLLFATLPEIFARLPLGWVFGALFFGGLLGAALLSGVAAYEVLVAGFTDALGWSRERATWVVYGVSLLLAVPPMINLRIFVPWDLAFGSGGQTVGALLAVVSVGWVMKRGALLAEIAGARPSRADRALVMWLRWVVPAAILAAALWWLLTDALGVVQGV